MGNGTQNVIWQTRIKLFSIFKHSPSGSSSLTQYSMHGSKNWECRLCLKLCLIVGFNLIIKRKNRYSKSVFPPGKLIIHRFTY
jgi:hypothetical protein